MLVFLLLSLYIRILRLRSLKCMVNSVNTVSFYLLLVFTSCIWLRRITVVEYLISEGVDINALNDENNAPLHWACLNGHVEKLENCRCERTPMDEAIGAEKMEIIDAINTTVAQMELENTRVTRLFQTSPSRHRKCGELLYCEIVI
ncbi:hypothetical protein ARALYDRAFT_897791 [Arabidopsis lyrata subsp. lyrata]|uniref:Uncharacterized protein n=1 Tax=Arabidopsis lyrata subsp. lyrata TaxID=81972 RepID=D7L3Z8_ARALL|nr:hypothetical protein ARALYDRAFT_897791 [Arabidopsis lyrata subsp. lyrata]